MHGPVPIPPARFFEFLDGSPVAVLFLSLHPLHAFNPALGVRLRAARDPEIAFGTVDLRALVLAASPAVHFLRQGLRACGLPDSLGVLPGYWLVRERAVVAWDPGLPTSADAAAIARGAILGAAWSLFTGRVAYLGAAVRTAAEEAVAVRLAERFGAAIAGRSPPRAGAGGAHRSPPPPAAEDLLARAYRLLGVATGASDEEVKEAWRRRILEIHPDRAAGDPAEFLRRTRLAAELNGARDLIARRRAAAA